MTLLDNHSGTVQTQVVNVVIGIRVGGGVDCVRSRNLKACLAALTRQSLPRHDFRIVIVEQDAQPRWERAAMPSVETHVFAYNPGPFNRGWAFNVGARTVSTGVLCLLDADLLLPRGLLANGLAAWRSGALAIRPYTEIFYLGSASTARVLARLAADENVEFSDPTYRGGLPSHMEGGCLWVDAAMYHRINGHDERFEGWGHEDREFSARLGAATPVATLPGRLLHLHHPRSESMRREGHANRLFYRALTAGLFPTHRGSIGDIHRYKR